MMNQGPQDDFLPYITPPNQQRPDNSVLIFEIQNDAIIKELERLFRGLEYDVNKKKYIVVGEPLMNEDGVRAILSLVKFYTSKLFKLGWLKEEDVRRMARDIRKRVNILLAFNYKKYGIQKNRIPLISSLIDHSVYITLRSSIDGQASKALHSSFNLNEMRQVVEQQKQRKFNLDFLNLFSKKGE